MKIPKSIRIGGVEYGITIEPHLNDGMKVLAGQIRYMDSQILIAAECSYEFKCLTLWHEIMHALEDQAQLDLGENQEHIIEAFARGVYQVLQDNGRRLFDLVAEEDKTPEIATPVVLRAANQNEMIASGNHTMIPCALVRNDKAGDPGALLHNKDCPYDYKCKAVDCIECAQIYAEESEEC